MTDTIAPDRARSPARPDAALPRVGIDCRCFQDASARRGVGRYVRGMLQGFQECGHAHLSVELLLEAAPRHPAEPLQDLQPDGSLYGFRAHETTLETHKLGWVQRLRALKRSLEPLDIALYHIPAQFYLYHHVAIPVPYVVSVMDLIPFRLPGLFESYNEKRSRRRLSRLRAACKKAQAIIAISEHTRQDCVEMLGLDPANIEVVPLGVDEPFNTTDRDDAATLERLGLPSRYFLFVGGQDGQKNFEGLLYAYQLYRGRSDDAVKLVVAGKRPKRPAYDPDRPGVQYLGFVADEDLPALYRHATAFVTLSTYEGFCLPAAEAMACGAPVVASDTTVFPKVVGDAGLLVGPEDYEAVAEALHRVESEPGLVRELSAKGLVKAAGYKWKEVGARTLEIYERVLQRGA